MNFRTSFIFFSIIFVLSLRGQAPKVSIITSLYKGEQFIEGFMEDIVRQTIFDQCELIIINANSPENESPVIKRYVGRYPENIVYVELDYDPGIYGVWNMAINMARGEFIINANVDDRRAYDSCEVHAQALEDNPDVDLVYGGMYETRRPNQTFANHSGKKLKNRPFTPAVLYWCQPGCGPMWRKSMHEKYGLFDATFQSAGDWDMWCRAVAGGSQFLMISGYYTLYYRNPDGLSSGRNILVSHKERAQVSAMYGHLWKIS